MEASRTQVNLRTVQLRKAVDLLELEWEELFPEESEFALLYDGGCGTPKRTKPIEPSVLPVKRKIDALLEALDESNKRRKLSESSEPEEPADHSSLPVRVETEREKEMNPNTTGPGQNESNEGSQVTLAIDNDCREKDALEYLKGAFSLKDRRIKMDKPRNDRIGILTKFVEKRGWGRPFFKFNQNYSHETGTFLCSVIVNDVEYKTLFPSPSKIQARARVAQICLESLAQAAFGDAKGKAKKRLLSTKESNKKAEAEEKIQRKLVKLKPPNTSPSSYGTLPYLSDVILDEQYQLIQKKMTIPDLEYSDALSILGSVKLLFSQRFASFRANMFRHYFLKLRDPGRDNMENYLLVFCNVDKPGRLSGNNVNFKIFSEGSKTYLPNVSVSQLNQSKKFNKSRDVFRFRVDDALELRLSGKGLRKDITLALVYSQPYILENQLCRLLQYMCLFDPRILPLLTLTRYWVQANSLNIGDTPAGSHFGGWLVPGPAALDWMVVSWMVGLALIPSPREIQSLDHDPLLVKLKSTFYDVGFHEDSEFAQEWKRKKEGIKYPKDMESSAFTRNVLELAKAFFLHYSSKCKESNWLLNTRDGELIALNRFGKKYYSFRQTDYGKLNKTEVQVIKERSAKQERVRRVCFQTTRFHVVNPLNVIGSLHVSRSSKDFEIIFSMMEKAGNQIRQLLYAEEAANGSGQLDLLGALKCL